MCASSGLSWAGRKVDVVLIWLAGALHPQHYQQPVFRLQLQFLGATESLTGTSLLFLPVVENKSLHSSMMLWQKGEEK